MATNLESIVQQEMAHIDARAAELIAELPKATGVIIACGQLIQCRNRYQAHVGEHTTVRSPQGLDLMDRLDEHVVRAMHRVTRDYIARCAPAPADDVRRQVEEELVWPFDIEFPVGDMIMRSYVAAMNAFGTTLRGLPMSATIQERIEALLLVIDARLGNYVAQRDTRVVRHHSDVAREYAVVARLGCGCDADGPLKIEQQALCHDDAGRHYDRLEVVCEACGTRREIAFALPHFGDLGQALDDARQRRPAEDGPTEDGPDR